MTLILGIDPGYSRCGFGVIRDNFSKNYPKKKELNIQMTNRV